MVDDDQHYCLRWNNYQSNMTSIFQQLLENEAFVDVTLACKSISLKAHKVVLSACSSYFRTLLMENPCKHPTIIMPSDVSFADLRFIIDFVYKGEIDVSQTELQSLLRTADQLKIKGLCDSPDDKSSTSNQLPQFYRRIDASIKKTSKHRELNLEDNNRRQYKYRCLENRSPLTTLTAEDTNQHSKVTINHEKQGQLIRELENSNSEENTNVDNDMPIALNERNKGIKHLQRGVQSEQISPLNMSSHGILTGQPIFSTFDTDDFPPEPPAPTAVPVGHVDMSDHPASMLTSSSIHRTDLSDSTSKYSIEIKKEAEVKFETLRTFEQDSFLDMDSRMSGGSHEDAADRGRSSIMRRNFAMLHRRELNSTDNGDIKINGHSDSIYQRGQQNATANSPKTWTQEDMDMALDALKNHNMSLTKASATYGIPSTTLWQRAHRMGIDTPKKEGPSKSWTEENLNNALDALRTGTISANKASKAYGIPSSTLYKIARREGIRLAAPFNAAPTTWTPEDLEKALESIRTGQTSVQKASTEFGIPTGTLYGRCKREGIELSRSNPTPWSEDAMGEALEAVRLGHMSINQAAIHYNLPYSSLYGRFKRGIKYDSDSIEVHQENGRHSMDIHGFGTVEYGNSQHHIQYQNPPPNS